jgi:DNA-binding GntR family transcriptional regulator
LNLDHLARELHVSNTPVRQALARLEADGLVTKEPYRGFAVSLLLDSRNTSEVYEFRLILEPALASRAADKATTPGADLVEIKELCATDVVNHLIAQGDAEQLGKRDYLFHIALARLAGNNIAMDSLTHALALMPGYTARDRNDAAATSWDEHQRIVTAVLAGDSKGAAAGMRDHLRSAYKRMRTVA